MAVLRTAIHPSHNTRGTETGCSYRTQSFMEDLDTSKAPPSSTLQCVPPPSLSCCTFGSLSLPLPACAAGWVLPTGCALLQTGCDAAAGRGGGGEG